MFKRAVYARTALNTSKTGALCAYSSGRFLYNARARLRERYVPFKITALKQATSKHQQGTPDYSRTLIQASHQVEPAKVPSKLRHDEHDEKAQVDELIRRQSLLYVYRVVNGGLK
ncbi:uncharacterized protein BDW47DRAFT_123081 [Aspergillus candidus]|uniref:Uncharacterized protein n=1 Tax=Aspergillus candidus TaxID=41067 RepID=A0A2I2FK66_ASPCN|nr:hypothetical protein BDW47DRAFT_123081 [Aspergillus candidus]PLB41019.1 hypothetical protein BDW47DRAFT_123081 [Aspergillus candidus]